MRAECCLHRASARKPPHLSALSQDKSYRFLLRGILETWSGTAADTGSKPNFLLSESVKWQEQ